nr:probable signal peptidase complex subunit 2 [Ipomoea batatas]
MPGNDFNCIFAALDIDDELEAGAAAGRHQSSPRLQIAGAVVYCCNLQGSFNSTGLVVSSKLPRFSDMYTLTIASADPQSISAKSPVELTKSVTQWFTKDGVLVEGLFWKDVEALIFDYAKENKKSK